jgi:hypothetical protein
MGNTPRVAFGKQKSGGQLHLPDMLKVSGVRAEYRRQRLVKGRSPARAPMGA